jgi:hypothetical protein
MDEESITPGYHHMPANSNDVMDDTADVRLMDDVPVQIDVLPLDTTSKPASGTPDTQSSD